MSEARLQGAIFSYSSLMVLARVFAMAQGIMVLKWMEPDGLGIWLGLQLIAIYGVHAHFGLVNAVNRQVPYHNGRGDSLQARRIANVTRGSLLLGSVVALAALLGLYGLGVFHDVGRRVVFFVTAATILTLNVQFYVGLFRARHQFARAGVIKLIGSLTVFSGLPLVYYFSLEGLCWRALGAATVSLGACILLDRGSFKIAFDWRETRGLIQIGFPILIVSYALVIFSSMDRLLIWLFLDEQAMGEYALCFLASSTVSLLPSLIGQVYYPRMTESYAAHGLSGDMLPLCRRASFTSAIVAGGLCLGIQAVLPWVVDEFFPNYVPGLAPLKITLVAYFILSLSSGPTYFLIATVQKRRQFLVLLVAAGLMALAGHAWSGTGLPGIAWALVLGVSAYVSGLWAVVWNSTRHATVPGS